MEVATMMSSWAGKIVVRKMTRKNEVIKTCQRESIVPDIKFFGGMDGGRHTIYRQVDNDIKPLAAEWSKRVLLTLEGSLDRPTDPIFLLPSTSHSPPVWKLYALEPQTQKAARRPLTLSRAILLIAGFPQRWAIL